MWKVMCVDQTWKADMIAASPYQVALGCEQESRSYNLEDCQRVMGSQGLFLISSVLLNFRTTNAQLQTLVQATGPSLLRLALDGSQSITSSGLERAGS